MERWHLRERQCCKPGVGNEGPALLLVGNPDGGLKVGRLLWTVLHPLLFCCCVFGLLLLHLLLLFTAPSLVTSHPFSFNHCRAPTRVLLDNCNWVPAFKCRRCCSAASLDDQQEASAQNNENWKKTTIPLSLESTAHFYNFCCTRRDIRKKIVSWSWEGLLKKTI